MVLPPSAQHTKIFFNLQQHRPPDHLLAVRAFPTTSPVSNTLCEANNLFLELYRNIILNPHLNLSSCCRHSLWTSFLLKLGHSAFLKFIHIYTPLSNLFNYLLVPSWYFLDLTFNSPLYINLTYHTIICYLQSMKYYLEH